LTHALALVPALVPVLALAQVAAQVPVQVEPAQVEPTQVPAQVVPAGRAEQPVPAPPGEEADRAAPAAAPEDPARLTIDHAESLLAESDLYRAIGEFKRFLHHWPADPRSFRAMQGIAEAYRRGGKLALAAAAYQRIAARAPGLPEGGEAQFQAAECFYQARQYAVAEAHYRTLLEDDPGHPRRDLAHYRISWTLIGREQYAEARRHLELTAATSAYHEPASRLAERLGQAGQVRRRSPWLAGLLAGLLPGSGHLYVGRLGDAGLALLVNAAFAVGTWEAAAHENYTAATLLGLFGLGFYLGNIFGAVNAAERDNELSLRRYVSDLVLELESPQPAQPPLPPPAPAAGQAAPGAPLLGLRLGVRW